MVVITIVNTVGSSAFSVEFRGFSSNATSCVGRNDSVRYRTTKMIDCQHGETKHIEKQEPPFSTFSVFNQISYYPTVHHKNAFLKEGKMPDYYTIHSHNPARIFKISSLESHPGEWLFIP